MLVLSRMPRQAIVLHDGSTTVVVEVVKVSGDRVTLGVTSPKNVKVLRRELKERDDEQRRN